eukprot:COSAG01_NODE_20351_length_958_cov_1.606519_1_plen_120_part_10
MDDTQVEAVIAELGQEQLGYYCLVLLGQKGKRKPAGVNESVLQQQQRLKLHLGERSKAATTVRALLLKAGAHDLASPAWDISGGGDGPGATAMAGDGRRHRQLHLDKGPPGGPQQATQAN